MMEFTFWHDIKGVSLTPTPLKSHNYLTPTKRRIKSDSTMGAGTALAPLLVKKGKGTPLRTPLRTIQAKEFTIPAPQKDAVTPKIIIYVDESDKPETKPADDLPEPQKMLPSFWSEDEEEEEFISLEYLMKSVDFWNAFEKSDSPVKINRLSLSSVEDEMDLPLFDDTLHSPSYSLQEPEVDFPWE